MWITPGWGRQNETKKLENGGLPEASNSEALVNRCVSIDLEVDPKTNRVQAFAGVRNGSDRSFVHSRGNLSEGLEALDKYTEPADFLLAHNLIKFDAQILENANPV